MLFELTHTGQHCVWACIWQSTYCVHFFSWKSSVLHMLTHKKTMRCLRHESLWSRNSEFCSAQLNVPQLVSGMFLALLRLALHITHDNTNGFPVPMRCFNYNYDAILSFTFVFTWKLRWDSVICLASVTMFIPLQPMVFFAFIQLSHCVSTALATKKKKNCPKCVTDKRES